MRNLIMEPKIKPQEPMAINYPVTGELTDEGEIKEISLKHSVKRKKRDHENMMQKNDKDLWELDRNTYKAVTDKIKTKHKSVFNWFNT